MTVFHRVYGASVRSPKKRRWMQETVINASDEPSVDPARIVLKPKLRAPLPRPEQVVRRRLLEFLSNSLDRKVSVISAPTGLYNPPLPSPALPLVYAMLISWPEGFHHPTDCFP